MYGKYVLFFIREGKSAQKYGKASIKMYNNTPFL